MPFVIIIQNTKQFQYKQFLTPNVVAVFFCLLFEFVIDTIRPFFFGFGDIVWAAFCENTSGRAIIPVAGNVQRGNNWVREQFGGWGKN